MSLFEGTEVPLIVNVTHELRATYDCLFGAMMWLGDAGKHACSGEHGADGVCAAIRPAMEAKGWTS